jgi:hypothetical protein
VLPPARARHSGLRHPGLMIAAMLSDVVGPVNSAKEFSKGKRQAL